MKIHPILKGTLVIVGIVGVSFLLKTILVPKTKQSPQQGAATTGDNKSSSQTGQKGIVSIIFDDEDPTIYSEGFTRMRALGLKGTNYINSSSIGKPGSLTKKQVQEMYDAGWTIGNHGKIHWDLTKRSDQEVIDIAKQGEEAIIKNGWPRGADDFCPPFNAINDHVRELIAPYVFSLTNDKEDLNTLPVDIRNISRKGVANNPPAVVKNWIDQAIKNGEYLHLNFHKIGIGNTVDYRAEDFQSVMDYIAQKQKEGTLEVMTMDEFSHSSYATNTRAL